MWSAVMEPELQEIDVVQEMLAAPLNLLVLLAFVLMGSRQAWKYYTQRALQKHELDIKRLELQAQVSGLGGVQPPPCQVRDVEQDQEMVKLAERMDEFDKRLAAMERRMGNAARSDDN